MPQGLEWIASTPFWEGVGVGLFGGAVSGLLGVSSGGVLVPALALALSLEQHRAQAVSLAAQVLPTSLPGVIEYSRKGHGVAWRWIAWISVGFLAGAWLGALSAGHVGDTALRWLYVGYLVLLVIVTVLRRQSGDENVDDGEAVYGRANLFALAGVGLAGGVSSGLLGIGGGLAMTALLVGTMRVTQHQAHAVSLAVTMLPLGLPAVWVYAQAGDGLPWAVVGGVVLGLALGTLAGARFATALPEQRLRHWFVALIVAMIIAMAGKALRWW